MAADAPSPPGAERPGGVLGWLRRLEDGLLALLLSAMIGLATLQILLRIGFESGLSWADPVVRILVLWLGLLGALAASRDDRHIRVDVLSRLLSPRLRRGVALVTGLFTAGIAGLIAWQSGRFVASELEFGSIGAGGLPNWALASVLPIAFGGIAVRTLLGAFAAARSAPEAEPGAPG